MYVDLPVATHQAAEAITALRAAVAAIVLDDANATHRTAPDVHHVAMPIPADDDGPSSPLLMAWWHFLPITLTGSSLANERYLRWLARARRRLFDRCGDPPTASRDVPAYWHESHNLIWLLEPATSDPVRARDPHRPAHRPH